MTQITDLGPLYEECECGRAKLCKTTYERSMDAADARVEALEKALRRMILYANSPDEDGNDWCRFCDADSSTEHNQPFDREQNGGFTQCPVEAARKLIEEGMLGEGQKGSE